MESTDQRTLEQKVFDLIDKIVPVQWARPKSSSPEQYRQDSRANEVHAVSSTTGEAVELDAGHETMIAEIEKVLDIFGNPDCNKHLIYQIIELLVVRLMPEIAEKDLEELLSDRGALDGIE